MKPLTWWDDFWLQTSSSFAGGLLVVIVVAVAGVIISILKKSWRTVIWGNVAKFLKWLLTIRVTTTKRIEAAKQTGVVAASDAYERGKQEILDQIAQERAVPLKKSRWVIGKDKKGDQFQWLLFNTADQDVVASTVTLDVDPTYFAFMSSADWEDLSGMNSASFRGKATQAGHMMDIPFVISWTDSREDRTSQTVIAKGGGATAAYGVI